VTREQLHARQRQHAQQQAIKVENDRQAADELAAWAEQAIEEKDDLVRAYALGLTAALSTELRERGHFAGIGLP
jgi:hypothetical protein